MRKMITRWQETGIVLMNKKTQRFLLMYLPTVFACANAAALPTTSPYNWSGFYVGATGGAVFSRFNTQTSTQAGPLLNAAEADAVNKAGDPTIATTGFMNSIEGGYNWQWQRLLIGLELDLQTLSTNGETNSGALNVSNQQVVLTSYGNNNWLFTARPRLGVTANNWLLYVTGGLGLTYLQSDFLFTSDTEGFESQRVSKIKPGYVIGAGLETSLTKHISLKAEYLFANFSNTAASHMNHNIPAGQHLTNSVGLQSSILRLGVDYHFNDQLADVLYPDIFPALFTSQLWETELGTRLFVSTGVAGAPQPLLASPGLPLISRLTFSNLTALSGETFARAEHISGVFAKGDLGAGTILSGQLNDEDFPAGGAYSNTLSRARGNLSYLTADLGYSFLKNANGKTGAFIGYNYFAQNMNIYNCKQLADGEVCDAASTGKLNSFMALSEDDYFNSLRIGVSTQMNITNRLTLTSEAAYLPIVVFSGTDMHNARQLIGPEQANNGDGAMVESVLDYQLDDAWSLGLGGRYGMWNMHNGSVGFDFIGTKINIREPARFSAERYGVFLQLNYSDKKVNPLFVTPLVNWTGLLVGGHLGGAWGKSNWSDPFTATPGTDGRTNVAGFGDKLRSTGPLAGFDLSVNGQSGQVVYGAGTSLSAADIRGENTLFSGLGGVNGQTVTHELGTLFGKFGLTFDRSLFYAEAGPAMLATTFKINANTAVLASGSQSETQYAWGWMGGIGIDYALTDHWMTSVEYNYIRIPHYSVSLPIQIINKSISANQIINTFNVGLNYKFNIFGT